MVICENLFFFARVFFYLCSFVKIFPYLWSSAKIISYLWSSVRIFLNHFYLWESLLICYLSFKTSFCFLQTLWKQASVWTPSSITNFLSSKHDNDILMISYVPIWCFYFEFFSFCVWLLFCWSKCLHIL